MGYESRLARQACIKSSDIMAALHVLDNPSPASLSADDDDDSKHADRPAAASAASAAAAAGGQPAVAAPVDYTWETPEERQRRLAEEERQSLAFMQRLEEEEQRQLTLKRKSSTEGHLAVKALLLADLQDGKPIPFTQANELLAPDDHKPGQLYSCVSCMDDDFKIEQVAFLDCHHFLCIGCTRENLKSGIESGSSRELKCHEPKCMRLLKYAEVRRFLADTDESALTKLWDKYQGFLLEDNLRLDPECRWCPKQGCGM